MYLQTPRLHLVSKIRLEPILSIARYPLQRSKLFEAGNGASVHSTSCTSCLKGNQCKYLHGLSNAAVLGSIYSPLGSDTRVRIIRLAGPDKLKTYLTC